MTGRLRVQSLFGPFPGHVDWPLLGCRHRSQDAGDGPFGAGRSEAGVLGMKVLGTDNTSDCNVVNEMGTTSYYTYASSAYSNQSGHRNSLYGTGGGGWLEERPNGLYFEYDSDKRLIAASDLYGNALYFHYDGSGHYQYVQSPETGRAVYFETDGSGYVTSIKDWGGRETALSYDGNGYLDKVVGPSLCVTYFDYDGDGNLTGLTDPEGRSISYGYDTASRLVSETYAGATTYFAYGLGDGVYVPNDVDCRAWYGRDSSPPNNLATWQETEYTGAQRDTVSTDNSSYVEHCNQYTPPSGPWEYAGHEFLFEVFEDPGQVTQIDVTVKVHVYSGGLFHKLYIWDDDGSSWTQLDSEAPWSYTGTPYVGTLSGSVTADPADCIDSSGHVHVLVAWVGVPGGMCVRACYAKIELTTS
jgi:YD repeat-containing protein